MATDSDFQAQWLDQRLDALDRALLGLLPRNERLDFVASIEAKLHERSDSKPCSTDELELSQEEVRILPSENRSHSPARRKRSRLALSSGILGIVALGLMLLLPVTYVVIAFIAEGIGEIPAIVLIGLNILAVTAAGALAGLLSLAAMLSLSRSRKQKRGLGWAVTGLCTSPMPTLVGALGMIFFVLPMLIQFAGESNDSAAPYVASLPSANSLPPMLPQDPPFPPPLVEEAPSLLPPASSAPFRPAPAFGESTSPRLETVESHPTKKSEANEPKASDKLPALIEPNSGIEPKRPESTESGPLQPNEPTAESR